MNYNYNLIFLIMKLENHFINYLTDELSNLNGTEFEHLCLPLIEMITNSEFEIKGHNLEMKPVRGSVDLIKDDDFFIIGQCGTDKDYFKGNKPLSDIESSIKNNPHFNIIYLFSNKRATGGELSNIQYEIQNKLDKLSKQNKIDYKYHIYDSERIAKCIYKYIYKTNKIEKILSYLPNSKNIYLSFPQTNCLPLLNIDYKNRPEEYEIEILLTNKDFIQIYGLSGIGKTQLAISMAQRLMDKFDTVLWFDSTKIKYVDFNNINLSRMNEEINLAYLLQTFKILIIFDNFNEDLQDIIYSFNYNNKKGSKCIITSLQQNIPSENSICITYLPDEIALDIISECKVKPTSEQIKIVIERLKGYPLLLDLIKRSVENFDISWEDIIQETNITSINDDSKNLEFADRIVGRYKERFLELFNLLIGLDNTVVSKQFLSENSILNVKSLIKSAIIYEEGEFTCRIHQIVLEAIKRVMRKDYSEELFMNNLKSYLDKYLFKRDKNLYSLMTNHKDVLLLKSSRDNFDKRLRNSIFLAYLYSVDTYVRPNYFIEKINELYLNPQKYLEDFHLYLEKIEIEQYQVKITKNEEYNNKIKADIDTLMKIDFNDEKFLVVKYHHIGKWFSIIKDLDSSEVYLCKALKLNSKSFSSLLRLARNYNIKKLYEKINHHVDVILSSSSISEVPISIKLSTYDLISNYQFKELRKKYIDDNLEQFTNDIYASLSENYSQTYIVIAKLANHLSYNFPEFYTNLCMKLPIPLDIDKNIRLKKDYGKILLAQFIYGCYYEDYKDKLFLRTEKILTSVFEDDNNDYNRKDLINLYLSYDNIDKALDLTKDIKEKSNKFMQQLLSKVYYAAENFEKALEYINSAISQEKPDELEYCAAFRHDKAKCLLKIDIKKAIETLNEAIKLQPNDKTKNEWNNELEHWKLIN